MYPRHLIYSEKCQEIFPSCNICRFRRKKKYKNLPRVLTAFILYIYIHFLRCNEILKMLKVLFNFFSTKFVVYQKSTQKLWISSEQNTKAKMKKSSFILSNHQNQTPTLILNTEINRNTFKQ